MSLNNPVWGEGYVPAYQISSTPYVTSSNITLGQIKEISFGSVTRFVTVKNTGASATQLAVGFTQNGFAPANSNYFLLSGSESFTAEVRVDRIFLSGSSGASTTFTVFSGLTPIRASNFLLVTASNGMHGVG